MPYYTACHKKNGKTKDLPLMTISEGDQWLIDNPNWDFAPGLPGVGDPHKRLKPSPDFREKLRHISKQYKDNKMNTW